VSDTVWRMLPRGSATDFATSRRLTRNGGRGLRRHLVQSIRATPTGAGLRSQKESTTDVKEGARGGTRGSPAISGAYRDRTGDLRLAKPALSQLS
jgi:hypothetical protein